MNGVLNGNPGFSSSGSAINVIRCDEKFPIADPESREKEPERRDFAILRSHEFAVMKDVCFHFDYLGVPVWNRSKFDFCCAPVGGDIENGPVDRR